MKVLVTYAHRKKSIKHKASSFSLPALFNASIKITANRRKLIRSCPQTTQTFTPARLGLSVLYLYTVTSLTHQWASLFLTWNDLQDPDQDLSSDQLNYHRSSAPLVLSTWTQNSSVQSHAAWN